MYNLAVLTCAEVALAQLVVRKIRSDFSDHLYERPECDDFVGTQVGSDTKQTFKLATRC